MIHFLYGTTGTDSSGALIRQAVSAHEAGKSVYLLVPERAAVRTERLVAEYGIGARTDVITFTRLCNLVFRRYGGICKTYVDKGAKRIIMGRTLEALSPALSYYKRLSLADTRTVEALCDMRAELTACKIAPDMLSSAEQKITDDTILAQKLRDISLICSHYEKEITGRYDDPDSMLFECETALRQNAFFADCVVFIDSFAFFTPVQYDIIGCIFRQAAEVYISLDYNPKTDAGKAPFASLARTDARLHALVRETEQKTAPDTVLTAVSRFEAEELAFAAEHLWETGKTASVYDKPCPALRVFHAHSTTAEAEAVALDIAKRVRAGARYRDFAVIMRNKVTYAGVLDAMLKKYEIPFFFSGRSDIMRLAPIRFFFAALDTVRHGWRQDDMIAYLKTGLSGASELQADLFEAYITSWNLSGARLASAEDYIMNPDGFKAGFTEESAARLAAVNEARRIILSPLFQLRTALAGKQSVESFCRILYEFYTALHVPEQTEHLQEALAKAGETDAASALSQCHTIVCKLLDSLVACAGDAVVTVDAFYSMLTLMVNSTEMAGIPTSVDEVLLTEAGAINFENVPYTYVVGTADGMFPMRMGEEGFFSEHEKEVLENTPITTADGETVCVRLPSRLENRLSDELYYFHTAVCSPRRALTLSYPLSQAGRKAAPASPVARLLSLFPLLKDECFENTSVLDMIERPAPALEYAHSAGGVLREKVCAALGADERYARRLQYMDTPLTASECRLSPECMADLFADRPTVSYSRLEKYITCHFSYFSQYELKIADCSKIRFGNLDLGIFMHRLMEEGVRYLANEKEYDRAKIKARLQEIAKQYLSTVSAASDTRYAGRLAQVSDTLVASADVFLADMKAEFDQSGFLPVAFEKHIGRGENDVAPLAIQSGDNAVSFEGVADRIDTYEDENGTLYARIIDYKTGSKEYNPEKVAKGLDLQMLLYLFSVCENGLPKSGKKPKPAGVLYVGVKPPKQNSTFGKDVCDIKPNRTGVLIEDEAVLHAMERELKGDFIPVKAADLEKKAGVLDEQGFEDLKNQIKETVLEKTADMRAGCAEAEPMTDIGYFPCDYCAYAPICRVKKK